MYESPDAKETVHNDTALHQNKLSEGDYRRIIMRLQLEIIALNTRVKGVQTLTVMFSESEGKCKRWEDTAKNYELTLKRAEARIAQLNKMLGVGPQTAFNRGVVMPGVSRKDFDSVTQENIRLKNALEHIVPTQLGGEAVIVKNRELYDLVSTLQKDLSNSENHIKALESALRGKGNGETVAMPGLTKNVMKLERSLNAKQVFCESLIKENDNLKKLNEDMNKSEKYEERMDSIDGKEVKVKSLSPWENPAVIEKLDELREENRGLRQSCEELGSRNADLKEEIKKLEEAMKKLEEANKNLDALVVEISTKQKEKTEEIHRKVAQEKEKFAKEIAEYRKKCDGFFQQVGNMNTKQKELEDELERMKRGFDHQTAEIEEKNALNKLMSDSLRSYEDDFRRENEEKTKLQKTLDKYEQENERTKRENQSHMATIRHLEDEFEHINKMLNEERRKTNDTKSKGGLFGMQGALKPLAAAGTKSLFQEHVRRPMQAVADGVGAAGVDESDGDNKQDPYSMPTTKSEASNAPSLIECPYCSRSYPYHLIEGHVQDCMEDSLYLDEND